MHAYALPRNAAATILALLVAAGSPPVSVAGATPADMAAYEAAKARVGRDPDAQVRLALWCEAHGLQAERLKHLAIAIIVNPRHSMARGLMGLVEYRGRWQRPEAVSENAKGDALLADYRERRAESKDNPDAQWALALWCDENGLKDEATAHFTAVVKRDPKRDAAWRRLGFKKKGQHWVTDAQLAEEKAEADRQKQADRHWKPLLDKCRAGLSSKSAKRRAEVEATLAEITDPRAVPMLGTVFTVDAARQKVAVRVLGQIDAPGASRLLAMLAAFGDSPEVRRTATETLKRRDPREFTDLLIGFLRDPIKYVVKPVGGPGSPGEIFIEGKQAKVSRRYSPPKGPEADRQPGDRLVYDVNGLPVLQRTLGLTSQTEYINVRDIFPDRSPQPLGQSLSAGQKQEFLNTITRSGLGTTKGRQVGQAILDIKGTQFQIYPGVYIDASGPNNAFQALALSSFMARGPNDGTYFSFDIGRTAMIPVGQMELEAQKTAAVAQQQLQNDVESLKRHNAPIEELNGRVLPILKEVAGQDIGDKQENWKKWWIDQIGYTLLPQKASETPTIIEEVPLAYQPQPIPIGTIDGPVGFRRMSCFGAGTPVHTLAGVRPIESLREGDRVLTQDIKTGALDYKPILVVHRNPPSPTYRITLGEETIVSSYFHRFWKVGQGWVMARDLEPGDRVRTLGGLARIGSIDTADVQPVFNLDVADTADFFVGRQGVLVHDNTLPDLRQTPFDTPSSLATARPVSR